MNLAGLKILRPADLISTWFGVGLSPKAPGTFGTLGAIPLVYFMQDQTPWLQWLTWGLLLCLATLCVRATSSRLRSVDPQSVVIDEVLGFWLAAIMFGKLSTAGFVLAFILFRAFDILKPAPIRTLDRYGKKLSIGLFQSFLVIADDLLAGFFCGLLLLLTRSFLPNLL
jgi:phosphatidylglycerophosphatase A